MLKFLKSLFNFRQQKKQLLHIVFIFYLLGFSIGRLWALFVGSSVYFGGFQIHHFYFGAIILSVGSVLALLCESQKNLRKAAALIGIGIGLFADEIGLLLNCTTRTRTCVYAFPDTGDIITTISILILFVLIILELDEKRQNKKNLPLL